LVIHIENNDLEDIVHLICLLDKLSSALLKEIWLPKKTRCRVIYIHTSEEFIYLEYEEKALPSSQLFSQKVLLLSLDTRNSE